MPRRFCYQNLKIEVESTRREEQVGERSRESQKKDDGAEQLPQREESRAIKIHSLIIKSEQGIGRAEGVNKQTVEQRVSIWCGLSIFESVNNCEITYSKCQRPMINSLPPSTATIARKTPKLRPKTSPNSDAPSRNQSTPKRNSLIIKIFMISHSTRKTKGLGICSNMANSRK